MNRVPDDDSRPGSATSLLRTVAGLYLRDVGGWMPVSGLIALMDDLGVPSALSRTAVARVKQRGLLVAERTDRGAGYRLAPDAAPMLEAGDRRIFTPRRMREGDPWCLVSFSLPEERRADRHQLRRRLRFIGCGTVSQGLWICPAFLASEVEQIIEELNLAAFVTLFTATEISTPGSVADCWDLDGIAGLHRSFADHLAAHDHESPFRAYVTGIDAWRPIPYLDPGLPSSLLPTHWIGDHSEQLFRQLQERLAEPARQHVIATLGGSGAGVAAHGTMNV
ncbi:phenylacetic acid degradation operon negative regulatory protein [Salinibacterium sp. CAN_S4]|uniref:PaaX family transcriptional regulator n=1 Tax=Salinibacterium sp. CAN_S4 TaxID=2787727 RepID=UPI0018EFC082